MKVHLSTIQLRTIMQQSAVMFLIVAIGGVILQHWLNLVWLLLGGMIGISLWWLDELVGLTYYRRNELDTELITRSPVFILVFAVIALFVVTSTDQHIGFGVIWGLSASLLVEAWHYVKQPTAFVDRFFGMVVKNTPFVLTPVQTIQITVGATGYILLLVCLWVLRLT